MGVCGEMGEFEIDQNAPPTGTAAASAPEYDSAAGYWIVTVYQVSDTEGFIAYTQQFDKVFVETGRCKVLHHELPKCHFESGVNHHVSVIEWPTVEAAINTKESSMYKAVCGPNLARICERDVRVVSLDRSWLVAGRGYWIMNVQEIRDQLMYDEYVEAFLANILMPENDRGYKGCQMVCGYKHILGVGSNAMAFESPRSSRSQRKDTIIVQFDSIEDAIAVRTDERYLGCMGDANGDATQFVVRDVRVVGCPVGCNSDGESEKQLTVKAACHGPDLIDAFS